ncbi:MAG: RNA polymerase sigma factor [Bacteroidota bacterium]
MTPARKSTPVLDPSAERIRDADPSAFAVLVDRYSDRLYQMVYRMLGREDEAEDAVQETFISAYENRHTFEGRSNAYTWLYRIAANNALMRLRARKRRGHTDSLDDADDIELRLPVEVHALPAAHHLFRDELEQQLQSWLDELPALTRTVFVLRDLEDMPIGEVASVTEQTEWAAKGRLKRARSFLRNKLSDYLAGEL